MPRQEAGYNEATGLAGAEHQQAVQREAIDAETSAAILAGFSYEVNGQALHFSYDRDDQQNFADTANACLISMSGAGGGLPTDVTWNGYDAEGHLVRVPLTAEAFLTLYAAALNHKAACMAAGGARKAELEG